MFYIPSPVSVNYDVSFQAITNPSGRMQYYIRKPGKNRVRISRADFIDAYNNLIIVAIRPLKPEYSPEKSLEIEFLISYS